LLEERGWRAEPYAARTAADAVVHHRPSGQVRFECRSVTTMTTWKEFTERAPRIAAIFTRRHAATGNLCLLATLRSDGYPRISPIEPRIIEDQL